MGYHWSLLATLEPFRTFTWNPYLPYLRPRNLLQPLLGTLTWNFGTFRNLPVLGTPSGTFTRNSYFEPGNLLEPLLGSLEPTGSFTWNRSLEPGNLLESLLGTLTAPSEPSGTFTWNPCLEPRNLAEPCGMTQSAPGPSLAETSKLSFSCWGKKLAITL